MMYGSRQILSLIILLCIMTQWSCKKEPPAQPPSLKNPRTYTWTVDTLSYAGSFQTLMTDIWASSPSNVYVVGFNDQGGRGTMFRYDGTRWQEINLGSIIIGGISLESIYGFAPNDVYAVGRRIYNNPHPPPNFLDSSLIIHFDGVQWSESVIQRGGLLKDVWGVSFTSIWTVGGNGTAYLFDGSRWERRRIRDDVFFQTITGRSASDVYALGYKLDVSPYDSIRSYVFHFDGQSWQLRDSLIANTFPPVHSFGVADIWALSSTEVFSVGYGIFKKADNGWTKIFDDNTVVSGIGGNASRNIFAVGVGIYHFNGLNWYSYEQFRNFPGVILRVWVDTNEVFAVGHDGNRSYVFHGK